jgi:transcriptional regulator with XRE-family HTH domain
MLYHKEPTIPHAVVGLVIKNDWPLVKAWRKHLKMSQKSLAEKAGISQPALRQMENSDNLRTSTLDKLAQAMGIAPEQLVDLSPLSSRLPSPTRYPENPSTQRIRRTR